jgi:hypothetical protein
MRWDGARGIPVSLRPDPNSNLSANPHLELESSRVSPPHTGRKKVGSPTLHTHQDPILLLPWLGRVDTLTLPQTRMLVFQTAARAVWRIRVPCSGACDPRLRHI